MDPITFTTKKHEGQTRKGTNLPYITHPFRAYTILKTLGYEEAICLAGLLHDTLEDTETTEEELTTHFGLEVTNLVKSVSKNISGPFNYETAPLASLIVKTADTLSNVEDYLKYRTGVTEEKFNKYLSGLKIAQDRLEKAGGAQNRAFAGLIEINLKQI